MVVWVNYKCVRKYNVHKTCASGIQNKVALLKQCENGLHPILLLVLHQQKRYLFSWNGNACTMGHFERTCLSFSSYGSLLLEEAWQWNHIFFFSDVRSFDKFSWPRIIGLFNMSPLKLNSMIKDLRDMHIFALNNIYFLRYVYERNFPSKKTCHK